MKGQLKLGEAVELLRDYYGAPAKLPTTDPFELVLLENVAYLASPARRREAFEQLKGLVGTSPTSLLKAKQKALESATARGILKTTFADKLRECASIALEKFDGDVAAAIQGPLDSAKRVLRCFPGIGEPGAEKILLFAGHHALLAPESNGLRVLVRLGVIREESSYAKTYANARVAAKELPADVKVMQEAHLLLQQHGQTLCKRNAPRCEMCPLACGCAYARSTTGSVIECQSKSS